MTRAITSNMQTLLNGDVRTLATCWLVQRTDNVVFGFTDHDQDLLFNGQVYQSLDGYDASAISAANDLSTQNMELTALMRDGGIVTKADVIAGKWNYATVTIYLVNFLDTSANYGGVVLSSGRLGQFTLQNGKYVAELRGLAQLLQQDQGQQYSPTCRATLGDSRCKVALGPLTYTGTVATASGRNSFTDAGLTAVGPVLPFQDQNGHTVPTTGPYTIGVVAPGGGSWQSDAGVFGADNTQWTNVSPSAPSASKQYSVSAGVYTFNLNDAGAFVRINFNYAMGYYAYGKLTWLTGANAGYSQDVKSNSVGGITLVLPMPFDIQPGDTYSVTPGCDRQSTTCINRFNNILNFRGEQFIPGPDRIFRSQGD